MSQVLGPRSWVFWWAALTATVFLRDAITWLSDFFRNSSIFAPTIPPFSLVSGLNGSIDGIAEWLRTQVAFRPGDVLIGAGPLVIYNWMIAIFMGILLLLVAALLYRRALASSALLDDLAALFVLYFVIRIEAHLFSLSELPVLSEAAKTIVGNQLFSFVVLLVLLIGLTVTGQGLRAARAFWRGIVELLVVAILLFPTETAAAIAAGLDLLLSFSNLILTNLMFAAAWAVLGIILALRRLYYVDVPT